MHVTPIMHVFGPHITKVGLLLPLYAIHVCALLKVVLISL